jgi:hypothetical protein
MGIFNRIFKSGESNTDQPNIRFGRYSDAYKPDYKYDEWDKSMDLFEEGKYDESFANFFEYLTDESQDNVKTWKAEDGLHFEVLQGSKLIKGLIGDQMIKAEAKVAHADELSIGFLRRMMELNFSLKYSRFALDTDDNLTLIFDSYLLDGSPYKMYYALKEMAVSADKQDDLLIGEFEMLKPINTGHLLPIPDEQKEIKVAFIRARVARVFKEIDGSKLNSEQYAGGVGYLLLDLAYRIDYLVRPEGALTEALERIHRIYFTNDNKSSAQKNRAVRKEFEKILERSDEDLKSEMYLVSSSFGITSPSSHEQLVAFIDSELKNMDWYIENRHLEMALAFPGYIAGYGLFNYAFQAPAKELLHLYYRITEPKYFKDLGYTPEYYYPESETLDKRAIVKTIEAWRERHKAKFPKLKPETKLLQVETMTLFAKSYFKMIRGLDMTKAER